MLDDQANRLGRVERHMSWEEKHESDLFLMRMAAEGRGHTILTRALQLVPGT